MRCLKLVRCAALALAVPVGLAAQSTLPDGPTRETVKKICGNCHEVESVISSRHTRTGWQEIIDDMISRGAEGTDVEMAAVAGYLTEWFGKINVNTATSGDLQKALNLSEKEARAITAYRERNGKIRNFEELEKVPGVDPEKLRPKRSLVAFSQ
jgi:competence ComEA-like helix-hairpin-helix protein